MTTVTPARIEAMAKAYLEYAMHCIKWKSEYADSHPAVLGNDEAISDILLISANISQYGTETLPLLDADEKEDDMLTLELASKCNPNIHHRPYTWTVAYWPREDDAVIERTYYETYGEAFEAFMIIVQHIGKQNSEQPLRFS